MKITLLDGVALNKQYPESFYIPSNEDKASLSVGDSVKIALQADGEMGERMWFTIIEKQENGKFVGELDSMPVVYTALEPGDELEFDATNIIDIA